MAGSNRNFRLTAAPLKVYTALRGAAVSEGTMDCSWEFGQAYSEPVQYIIAYLCDKCGAKQAITLCKPHYSAWLGQAMYCPGCGGTLSWQIHDLTSGETRCMIN